MEKLFEFSVVKYMSALHYLMCLIGIIGKVAYNSFRRFHGTKVESSAQISHKREDGRVLSH